MSAGLGAVVWLAAPWVPAGTPPSFGSIEHIFTLLPLVAVPLALILVIALLERSGSPTHPLHRVAQRVQPLASALALASFFVPKGAAAGVLAAGWLLLAGMVGLAGVRSIRPRAAANLSNVSLFAAHLLLPFGGVWLLLSRLGVAPGNLSALTVFLAALHLHFSGFTLQILIAATGRQLESFSSRLQALHRVVAVGAVGAIPFIMVGNLLAFPALKFVGVSAVVLSTISLSVVSTALALQSPSPTAKRLLLVSAASILAAMVIAGIYGVGEVMGSGWIDLSRMVETHGLLNALGFVLCGLGAHLHLQLHPSTSGREVASVRAEVTA